MFRPIPPVGIEGADATLSAALWGTLSRIGRWDGGLCGALDPHPQQSALRRTGADLSNGVMNC